MGQPPFRIEISTTISGVDFAPCHARRVDALIDGLPVPVIDLANLRLNDLEHLPVSDEGSES